MEISDSQWDVIVDTVNKQECVPFLGAGASLGFDGPGLPTAGALAKELAQACKYQGSDHEDFLRVCQYYELLAGRQKLRNFIIERLTVKGVRPGKIHRILAGFPLTHVLTTNYDRLMERAFEDEAKSPQVAFYNIQSASVSDLPTASIKAPIVYKLHGTMDAPASMICTEDDVVHFLARIIQDDPGLPPAIKELFERRSFLFIGYGLRDWNIRVLIRAFRYRNPSDWIRSFAVQRRPGPPLAYDWDTTVMYFDKRESISLFDQDAGEFMDELERRCNPTPDPGPAPSPGSPRNAESPAQPSESGSP